MSAEVGREDSRKLAQMLLGFGITRADHPALNDRGSLGRYLVNLDPPKSLAGGSSMDRWRDQRRILSQAGVDRLREAIRVHPPGSLPAEEEKMDIEERVAPPTPADAAPDEHVEREDPVETKIDVQPEAEVQAETPAEASEETEIGEEIVPEESAEAKTPPAQLLALIRQRAPDACAAQIAEMEELTRQNRFVEAFRVGMDAFTVACEESLVNACVCVARMASRWDREARIAPYSLCDGFDALGAGFGKHVHEMRHIDPDPLRATSGLYRLASKIYFGWVEHCAAILEHQHRRTNTKWVQLEWVQPHRFNCLLAIMRSAVRIKLPLDLLLQIYQKLRQAIGIGKSAIALDTRKAKFEGDCLRILASPSKDLIPDLCYIIYRDIIETYIQAGENASVIMFCDQALLLRRGDHEVEQIKAEIIAKSGRQNSPLQRHALHQRLFGE